MFRFAFSVWLAALAGASLIDLVADTLNRALFEPAGLIAIGIVPALVALAFVTIASAAGAGKRAKDAGATQADGVGDLEGGSLNPNGPVVVQLRELCRGDTRTEIANQRSAGDLVSTDRAAQIARSAVEQERQRVDASIAKRPRVSKGWQSSVGAPTAVAA